MLLAVTGIPLNPTEGKRLPGIMLLAAGNVLAAVPLLLWGTLFLMWRGESGSLDYPIAIWILLGGVPLVLALAVTRQLDAVTAGGDLMAKMMGVSKVGGLVFVLFAAFDVAMGVGLWKRRKWARIINLALAPLNFLLSLLSVRPWLRLLPLLALYAGSAWYLFRQEVKNSFET